MVYKHAIFMRLGMNPYNGLDGRQVIQEYDRFIGEHGAAWFSTGALSAGMSERMRCEFADAIDYHYVLELYFAVPDMDGGGSEIAYKAEVAGIETGRPRIPTPDPGLTPVPFRGDLRSTWLKICNIQPTDLTADDFIVINTGNRLSRAIAHSQYHFGYIKRVG